MELRSLKGRLQSKVDLKEAADRTKWRLLVLSSLAESPFAHPSDQGKDDEADQYGLTPATLRARFESEVAVNDWLVMYSFVF